MLPICALLGVFKIFPAKHRKCNHQVLYHIYMLYALRTKGQNVTTAVQLILCKPSERQLENYSKGNLLRMIVKMTIPNSANG